MKEERGCGLLLCPSLCTPPIPPVTNIGIPTARAHTIVPDTVVPPLRPYMKDSIHILYLYISVITWLTTMDRSRLDTFTVWDDALGVANCSNSLLVKPVRNGYSDDMSILNRIVELS